MATIFTRIIDGEIPAQFVWKDEHCVAFLSINPLRDGHTLVVPRAEVDHWLDLEPWLLAHLVEVARAIGRATAHAYSPARIGLMIAGLEVPHTHLHVVAVDTVGDLDLHNAASAVPPEMLAYHADKLRRALRDLGVGDRAENG